MFTFQTWFRKPRNKRLFLPQWSLRSGKNAECDLPPRCIVLFALEQRICNCVHICSFIFYMPLLVRYHNLSITVYKEFPEIDGDTLKWFSCN